MSGETKLIVEDSDRAWNRVILDLVAEDRRQRVFEVESDRTDLEARRTRDWNHKALDRVCETAAQDEDCSAPQ